MKRTGIIKIALLLLLIAGAAAAGASGFKSVEANAAYSVAVIVKSTESAFFRSVFSGANAAGTEYNVKLTFQGPQTEEDFGAQNEMIRQAVKDKVQAIVFSAVDFNANAEAIDEAARQGVKIVVIDSDVNSGAVSCRIGTDNYAAGRMAGQAALSSCSDSRLRIGIVNFDEKTANGQQREAGFREIVENDTRVENVTTINVLSTIEDARRGTRELLTQHPEINVVATFNEWTSLGVGWAIRDLSLQEDTAVVAFDSNAVSVGMLETGEVDTLIVQNPYAMGYLGVETACGLLSGNRAQERQVDTETVSVNRDNMYSEECQKILFALD